MRSEIRLWLNPWKVLKGAFNCIRAQIRAFYGTERPFEDQVQLLNICKDCEIREGDRCGSCGCLLKLKIADPASTCPEEIW